MKKALFTVGILASVTSYDQVGINTTTPKATLDVVAAPSDITKTDGLIAPRLTGNELKAKDALYTTDQTGAIVYATAAASPTTSKTLNVTEPGYFYFDGAAWVKLTSGAATGTEPWYIQGTTNPATQNTQNIYQMGNVAIGTESPVTEIPFFVKGIPGSGKQVAQFYADTNQGIGIFNHDTTPGNYTRQSFQSYRTTDGAVDYASIGAKEGKLFFSGQGSYANVTVIDNSGQMGIYTENPIARLDARGSIRGGTLNSVRLTML